MSRLVAGRQEDVSAVSMGDPGTDPRCDLGPPLREDAVPKSSLRGASLVAVVMFGWLVLVAGMSAVVARNDPNVEIPVEVSRGVVVMPADGWYSAEDVWDVGESGISLQKSGVYAAFWVDEYRGSNEDLMTAVIDELSPSFESFRALPARSVTIAGDLAGLRVRFSGTTEWGYEEGELVTLSYRGTSLVMLVEALTGQLDWVQDDIDWMLDNLEVPR